MKTYYNESDPFCCEWLANLGAAEHIAQGVIDGRSIRSVEPNDLAGFNRAHFFAGIGVWEHALRLAGFSGDCWTGSCPCQPFSVAGRRKSHEDARHLWPEWFRLIRECRPSVVFGEQVASADGLRWFDAVSVDLEGEGYAVGAADLCAAGCGAPHIRQRIYFVAYAGHESGWRGHGRTGSAPSDGGEADHEASFDDREAGVMGGSGGSRRRQNCRCALGDEAADGRAGRKRSEQDGDHVTASASAARGMADADGRQPGNGELQRGWRHPQLAQNHLTGFWANADWIPCIDGKARPVEPGSFPLASVLPRSVGRMQPELRRLAELAGLVGGIDRRSLNRAKANRTGRLRGYGNALTAEVAATFIRAAVEAMSELSRGALATATPLDAFVGRKAGKP